MDFGVTSVLNSKLEVQKAMSYMFIQNLNYYKLELLPQCPSCSSLSQQAGYSLGSEEGAHPVQG